MQSNGLKVFSPFAGVVESYSVSQTPAELRISDGQNVPLQRNVSTSDRSPDLFWYRQSPSRPPQHLLTAVTSAADGNKFALGKFSTVLYWEENARFINRMRLTLEIEGVSLQDLSVYYCVIRPSVEQGRSVPVQNR